MRSKIHNILTDILVLIAAKGKGWKCSKERVRQTLDELKGKVNNAECNLMYDLYNAQFKPFFRCLYVLLCWLLPPLLPQTSTPLLVR